MRGVVISVVFHTLLVLAVAMGLPWLHKTPAVTTQTMTVDVVRLSDITKASKGEKPKPRSGKKPDSDRDTTKKQVARDQTSAKKSRAAAKPSKAEPKQTVQKAAKPEPKTAKPKSSETAPQKKAAPPAKRVEIDPRALKKLDTKPAKKKPAPEKKQAKKPAKKNVPKPDKQLAKATPTDKPKVQQKPDRPKIAAKPRPRPRFKKPEKKKPKQVAQKPPDKKAPKAKPKPKRKSVTAQRKRRPEKRNALDSVFKSVKKFKRTAREESNRDRTSERKPTGTKSATRSRPMTLSEIDAVRHQIKPCWRFPVGAKNAEALRVLIKLWMNRDGTVRRAQVMDRARMTSDSHFRAAAEAGRRAVMNPACNPLRLPAAKYDRWKVLIIDFDPSKLRTG